MLEQTGLLEVLDCGPEDLQVNAIGQISDGQRARANNQRLRWLGFGVIFLVVIGFVMMQGRGTGSPLILFIVAGVLVYPGLPIFRITADLNDGRVEAVTGPATLSSQRRMSVNMGSSRSFYYVTIEEQSFSVSAKVQLAFSEGQTYTLYYLPRSKFMVGAESTMP